MDAIASLFFKIMWMLVVGKYFTGWLPWWKVQVKISYLSFYHFISLLAQNVFDGIDCIKSVGM